MGKTSIEWCDFSINPIRARWKRPPGTDVVHRKSGHYCEKVSPGCKNCYASRLQPRFGMPTFDEAKIKRGAMEFYLDESKLQQVLKRRKPTRYFWNDMSDIFGGWVPDEWIDKCFATMALTPQHTHQVLTKRAERMRDYFAEDECRKGIAALIEDTHWLGYRDSGALRVDPSPHMASCISGEHKRRWRNDARIHKWPLPNAWLGVSAENDEWLQKRWRYLRDTLAAVRFISYEPALNPLRLRRAVLGDKQLSFVRPDWVIAGAESGPNARPYELDWFREVRDDCEAMGTAFFLKQFATPSGKKLPLPELDGRTWDQFPEARRSK